MLKKQILNPYLHFEKFEKEVNISQNLHILNNGNILWIKIKNIYHFYLEDFKDIKREEQDKLLLKQAKRIFTTVLETFIDENECIPNKFKLFGIMNKKF